MSTYEWAQRCFGLAELGDVRRTRRLVSMARRTGLRPAGKVTEVFRIAGERQAAYDLLEHDQVPVDGVAAALFDATMREIDEAEKVFVVLDGTSIGLVDRDQAKPFGSVGALNKGGRGLKLINALALDHRGTPIGIADQVWWSRLERAPTTRNPAKRESRHWRDAVARIDSRRKALAPSTTLHFIADREADATRLIQLLRETNQEFTIRSNGTRRVAVGALRVQLRTVLAKQRPVTTMRLELPATENRPARVAKLEIRAAELPIVLRDRQRKKRVVVPLNVVWAQERSKREGIEWVLLTNVAVSTSSEACEAVKRYAMRWRIEDFHKTWKSGLCCVEDTQLRSTNAVIKWATILAAVASRAERLRRRARDEPAAPATVELSDDEIQAVVFLKSEGAPTQLSADGLTIAQATRWIADLGGYVGARGSGLPGATTIGRGLERVFLVADVLSKLRAEGRLR